MAKISVIVPVYKVESYLNRCVDSILSQSFSDFELILVDDGSPDNCGAICDNYARDDARIRVIHKENGGLSSARNAGIEIASGEYLTFVDSDDYIHPDMLSALFSAIQTHQTALSICGYAETHGEPLSLNAEHQSTLWNSREFFDRHNVNAIVAWGKLYHRNCFKDIRYPAGKLHEDEFVTYRILLDYETVAVIPGAMYGYFQNDSGIMRTQSLSAKRLLNRSEYLAERFYYACETNRLDPALSARKFLFMTGKALYALSENNLKVPEAWEIRRLTKTHYSQMCRFLNKYDKFYLYLLRFPGTERWIVPREFEGLQDIARMIKGIR